MSGIVDKLKGGDLRSIGNVEEVIKDILGNPTLFGEVFEGMLNIDPVVRMRSADAIEKVSSKRPEYLQPFKTKLIDDISKIEQKELQWHVAQMFSYLEINKEERDKIVEILLSYIDTSKSNIVIVFSMQTLADFAEKDPEIRSKIAKKLKDIIITGSPSIVSRGKKLIKKLES